MALYLVATPIGNSDDISKRALDILRNVQIIILEEFKESTSFLRSQGISGKTYEQLNEHSTPSDLDKLLELCKTQDVALITDCGTPGFADPGADLVQLCRKNQVPTYTLPGASSLMGLLSLSSQRLSQFVFRGFLAAESELRQTQWIELKKEKRAIVLMDTPYRLEKMIKECAQYFPDRKVLITLNLTQADEKIIESMGRDLTKQSLPKKAEFMMLIYPA